MGLQFRARPIFFESLAWLWIELDWIQTFQTDRYAPLYYYLPERVRLPPVLLLTSTASELNLTSNLRMTGNWSQNSCISGPRRVLSTCCGRAWNFWSMILRMEGDLVYDEKGENDHHLHQLLKFSRKNIWKLNWVTSFSLIQPLMIGIYRTITVSFTFQTGSLWTKKGQLTQRQYPTFLKFTGNSSI